MILTIVTDHDKILGLFMFSNLTKNLSLKSFYTKF